MEKELAAAALLPAARSARAQGSWPGNQTIKLVVPYPAGGATDVIGRIVADRLAAMWHTSVIVENIAGAAGSIGMDRVAKGPTDGSTLLMVPPQIAINQFLYPKLAFDPEKDLIPIAQVASLPNILVVKKQLAEVNSVKDLIAYAKANPGKLNYASSGNGTTIHLSAELFKSMTGTSMNHIPYRGSAPAVNDLVGGQVDLMFDNATSIIGQVRGNTVKTLGVTSLKRSPLLPDLPTVAETVPGYDTAVLVRPRRARRRAGRGDREGRGSREGDRAGSRGEGADGGSDRRPGRVRPQDLRRSSSWPSARNGAR